jgi:hypothetical protein
MRLTIVSVAALALAAPCLAAPSGLLRPNLLVPAVAAPEQGRERPYALTGDRGEQRRHDGREVRTEHVGTRVTRDVVVPR